MKKLLLLLALASSLSLTAQEVAKTQIRTLCFERDSTGIDELAVIGPDKSIQEIRFPDSFPSQKFRVPIVEGKIYFVNPAANDGKPVAIASIPRGMKNALVMFFPHPAGSEEKTAYRTVVIDASSDGIPVDGALVMNLFGSDVRVVVGEHRILLKPGKTVGLPRPKKRNDYNMAAVVMQAEVKNEWKTMAETVIRFPPGQQQFFVSYPNPRSKGLALRSYQLNDF